MPRIRPSLFVFLLIAAGVRAGEADWRQVMARELSRDPKKAAARAADQCPDARQQIAVAADWALQDNPGREKDAVRRVIDSLGQEARALRARLATLDVEEVPASDPRWMQLYLGACERRRAERLAPYREMLQRVVFTKHYNLGGSHYAYTEGQSDAQRERHFKPGAALCVLQMDGLYGTVETLIEDKGGVIRDPDVSYDASRILFAWKKSLNEDDYHLYDYHLSRGSTRQLTEGLGFADYEGAYLPSGDIVFNSTRCVQTVDCWWTEVSNLYTCDGDGRYLRRLSFDQVHTNYPTVTHDGRVIYTRWDYSDRGQIYPQGLFQMNPDGTGQAALYGNNSWFPTTILHARGIPGSQKIVCVFSGHHSHQRGQLGILDPSRGREEADGAQLIAPVRETRPVRVDAYGQTGAQFQYPYPLSETAFLVTLDPLGSGRRRYERPYAIYWINIDGERELLVSDPAISCNQPVPLRPRPVPHQRPQQVDYRTETATVFLQDIYQGPGLKGVERGRIKGLRVVALGFRAAGIGSNRNRGPAGGALISTPVSIEGTWDTKTVLGTARVHPDGSAFFTVPARTPIYFQALDEKGHAAQSMRSWVTLQPGESISCVGCHEAKGMPPPPTAAPQALLAGPQELEPLFDGPPQGFSFIRHVQPILDKHCVRCHDQRDKSPSGKRQAETIADRPYDPRTMRLVTPIGPDAEWRVNTVQPPEGWTKPSFDDSRWSTARGGLGDARVPGARASTPWGGKGLWIRRAIEIEKPLNEPALVIHHDDSAEVHLDGRLVAALDSFTVRYEVKPLPSNLVKLLTPGKHTLAVHVAYEGGGRYIDAGIVDLSQEPASPKPDVAQAAPEVKPAFSLLGAQSLDKRACRKWSDAYKALANRRVCNWINIQSAPPMLPPYHAGAAKSKLITLLEEGHNGVRLSNRELHLIATWIDLLVPYAGRFTEAMEERHVPKYEHFLTKRRREAERETRNIQALLQERQP
jgi:hypothetical protein